MADPIYTELIRLAEFPPAKEKKTIHFYPPAVDPLLQLKWGLTLLGEEKAKQYLDWIQARLNNDSQ